MYNPFTHAEALGLRVVLKDPGHGDDGWYDHQNRTIWLRPGMTYRAQRSTLAHEIVHHQYGDEPTHDPVWHAKREARCNRIAAHRLLKDVDPNDTAGITDMAEWCRIYDVLPWVITTHLERQASVA
ncbi:ImmA/IrrE family metallo-endopeptidase [Rothia koreensis]|nr:ImmA/IrrE family metallo-endopeptidase [Rothia koreensis]